MLDIPTLSLIIGTGAIDAINPSAIAVLALIMGIVLGKGRKNPRMLLLGYVYVLTIFVIYFAAGLGLLYGLGSIPTLLATYLSMLIGIVAILAGLIQLKDYFGFTKKPTIMIPQQVFTTVEQIAKRKSTIGGVLMLGTLVAIIELTCTGAPYFVTLSVLHSNITWQTIALLVIYNLVFIAPLALILILVAGRTKVSTVQRWKEEHTDLLRIGVGVLLIAMGWIVLLITNGVITFG